MQMAAKIVYYGPGLCGKTSNLSFIYAKTSPNSRGEMVSLEPVGSTLFFDLPTRWYDRVATVAALHGARTGFNTTGSSC
jgi:hypothetical protein